MPGAAMPRQLFASCLIALGASCGSPGSLKDQGDTDPANSADHGPEYRDWTDEELQAFRHRSIGGRLLPLDWFLALELPGQSGRWVDNPDAVHERYGVVFDPETPNSLPIGFTKTNITKTYLSPYEFTGEHVGVNCAGCHTGEIHYQGETLLIDGGSGRINLQRFFSALRDAVAETAEDWWLGTGKFWRFWSQVDTGNWTPQQLFFALEAYVFAFDQLLVDEGLVEGFGRSDTVAKGISVFAYFDARNETPIVAPVSVPVLWNTHLYDYRHNTGSIRQALARDISATISGGAAVVLEPGPTQYASSADIDAILFFEDVTSVLAPPVWPEHLLGPLDPQAAQHGALLYAQHCESCHTTSLPKDGVLGLPSVHIDELGTDELAATSLAEGVVYGEGFGLGVVSASEAFEAITTGVQNRAFDEKGYKAAERDARTEGGRPNDWRAPLAYKATPLQGIWASPPYLHNGSVLILAELLLPPDKRTEVFRLCADSEYDPVGVGLTDDARPACVELDTKLPGNRATGHIYGTKLNSADRSALVAFLKTL
jgi:hypothetical protein